MAVPIVDVRALAPAGGWLAARARVERYPNQLGPGLRVGEVIRVANSFGTPVGRQELAVVEAQGGPIRAQIADRYRGEESTVAPPKGES